MQFPCRFFVQAIDSSWLCIRCIEHHNTVNILFIATYDIVVILSDIHANLAALSAFPEHDLDALWRLGDLVDYGPHDAVRRHLTNQEERRASQLMLSMLSGHRSLCAPWQI